MVDTSPEMPPERFPRRELLASTTAIGSAAITGCLTDSPFGRGTGSIRSPARTNVGDPIHVRVSDFEPHTPVTLDFDATDVTGERFSGSWTLRTDDDGKATLSNAETTDIAPNATWYGSKRGLQVANRSTVSMILHRLTSSGIFASSSTFLMNERNAVELSFRVHTGLFERTAARGSQTRVFLDPGISRRTVRTKGMVGWLYEPSTPGPHPGVVTLHGVLASVPHRLSRMLATHGYTTLALQYFDAPGLPESLEEIPLEYFARAIRWLTERSEVRDDGVGLIGVSRGVEAALLTAADYDGPATVIGYSGGGVVRHGVAGVPPTNFTSKPAWTRNGSPVTTSDSIRAVFDAIEAVSRNRCTVASIPDAIRSRISDSVLERVLVPVEEIEGPVLLLAGGDDQQWPSVSVSALTIGRLRRRGHPHPYGLRAYCDTGHIFAVPYADYSGDPTSDENGGTPKANARAAADSWPVVLDYLDRGFR